MTLKSSSWMRNSSSPTPLRTTSTPRTQTTCTTTSGDGMHKSLVVMTRSFVTPWRAKQVMTSAYSALTSPALNATGSHPTTAPVIASWCSSTPVAQRQSTGLKSLSPPPFRTAGTTTTSFLNKTIAARASRTAIATKLASLPKTSALKMAMTSTPVMKKAKSSR